jgi:phosphatidylserine decarboxylase
MATLAMTASGKLAVELTRDPVLVNVLDVLGTSIGPANLATMLGWRVAMDAGNLFAKSRLLRGWIAGNVTMFHRLNRRFDEAAQAIAFSELATDADRHRWCRVFGIDPEIDLAEPLETFKTVNELFTHAPGPGTRPIEAPDDSDVVTAPCDGSYALFPSTERLRSFVSKQSHVELDAVLGARAKEYAPSFKGGAAAYIWLSLVDNHRWFAPIAGRVVHAERIGATTHGRMGLFLEEGYCEANTRGVIIIEADSGLRVAFVPIGLNPINSVTLTVKTGDRVEKGHPLGTFEVGGSAGLLLFDRTACVEFGPDHPRFESANDLLNLNYVAAKNKSRLRMGQRLAWLRTR